MTALPQGGAVAQLGERVVRNDEVSGSIPLSSTKYLHKFCIVHRYEQHHVTSVICRLA